MKLFFDRNSGRRFPQILRDLRIPAEILIYHEIFPQQDAIPDDIWLSRAGTEGWIVISHESKWQRVPAERQAIIQHQVGCFSLWGASAVQWKKARALLRAFEEIQRIATSEPRPFLYRIIDSGRIERKNLIAEMPDDRTIRETAAGFDTTT